MSQPPGLFRTQNDLRLRNSEAASNGETVCLEEVVVEMDVAGFE